MRQSFLAAALLLVAGPAIAQDVVIRALSAAQAEKILKARKLAFKRNDPDVKGNVVFDFKHNGLTMAFYLFAEGKDIMVDAVLPARPIEAINQWNSNAKFSRACLRPEGKKVFTFLEANLDLQGGVTLEAVERFLDTFDKEVSVFLTAGSPFKDEPVIDVVSEAQLEKMLSRLGLKFTKKAGKETMTFDFELHGHKVKLASVKGKELFLDAIFPAVSLERVNRFNLSKKFVRVVNLKTAEEPFTTLQAALDLTGGVSETIVLSFLGSFEGEVEDFLNFVRKSK